MEGGPVPKSACVEGEGSFFTSLIPQSGKTTGMLHVAEAMALAENDTSTHPESCHTGIHFCSINKTRITPSRG